MSEKRFPKGSEEWMMFMDYWQLCQKYWDPEESDEYWENVIKDTNAFCEKYGKNKFVIGITLALVNSLEDKLKRRKGD